MNDIKVVDAWTRVILCLARLNSKLEERRMNLETEVSNESEVSVALYNQYVRDAITQRRIGDIMRMVHNIGNRVSAEESQKTLPDGLAPPFTDEEIIDTAVAYVRKVLFAVSSMDARKQTSAVAFTVDVNSLIAAMEGLKGHQF